MANCSGSLAKATSQVSTFTFGSISPDNNAPYDVSPQKYDNSVDTYNLLAPIGGLKSITTNGGTCPIDPKMAGGIGCYLNIIFKIGIGLAGALSVIMIVIGGVQYMGNESIFGKNEAKSKIMSAILGLLIALGAFALLNTINPDLTGAKGVQIDQVSAEIDEAPILSDANTSVPSGTTNSFADCPGGVRKVGTTGGNFIFCSAYASKLQQMFSDAYHANPSIFLSGGGFRTHDSQIALRNKNCPDPKLTVPSSSCHPPTARPGTSNHEQGLAVDLTCDGELINWQTNKSAHDYQPKFPINQKTKKCFDWLASNAGNYGFKNLSSENWHWSTGPNAGR
ncbi:MAG: M15 family metallopeptidase [Patescibacteria group bacterium]|nr:M15 family metallopeptidase [Patescibacteria group bacterium]